MKLINVIFLILIAFQGISQESLPVLREFEKSMTCWSDTDINKQVLRWSNGISKLKYQQLNDSLRLRLEFYESGNLKLTAEVLQGWGIDSSYTEDWETGEFRLEITSGYTDKLHGEYKEFWDSNQTDPKVIGMFKNGMMTGIWTRQTNSKKIEATYNDHGRLDGPYIEYYFDHQDNTILKLRGNYIEYERQTTVQDIETGEVKSIRYVGSEKNGMWEYYDRDGQFIKTVTYDWKVK